jgi:hypothetical protein
MAEPPIDYASRRDERLARELRAGKVWVRAACIAHGERGPYHWTEACVVEAPSLVEIDREVAEASPNLRPCKLCEAGGKNLSRSLQEARRHHG